MEYTEEYIDELAKTLGARFKEHLKASSKMFDRSNITGHKSKADNFSIRKRKDQNLAINIKELPHLCIISAKHKWRALDYNICYTLA